MAAKKRKKKRKVPLYVKRFRRFLLEKIEPWENIHSQRAKREVQKEMKKILKKEGWT